MPDLPLGRTGTRSRNKAASVPNSYAVAALPPATANAGRIVYVTNGNAGAPCLAVSNGTNWLRIALGAAVSAA